MRVHNAFVLYLLSTQRLAAVLEPKYSSKISNTGVSERGRRKLYFDPTFVIAQKLAELYSLT